MSVEDNGVVDSGFFSFPLWYWLPALLFCFLLTLTVYFVYSGLLTPISVGTEAPKFGDLVIAYKTQTGPYKYAGEIFTEAFLRLPHRNTIGIYYDDPEAVPSSELRFAVGSILAEGEEKPDMEEIEEMREHGFKIATLPKPNYTVMTDFPFRTSLSIYLAIFRVYPKLKEYITSNSLCAYPAVEIYTSDTIHFSMPLSRREEWFVKEFADDEVSIATTEMSTDSRSQKQSQQSFNNEQDIADTSSQKGDIKQEDIFTKPEIPVKKVSSSAGSTQQGQSDEDLSDFEVVDPEEEKSHST